ncbi:MAG: Fe-S cluster assembly protein SufD [Chitinophagales bacterium]
MGILQTYPHIFRALESNLGVHSNSELHRCKQEAMDRLTAMGMPTRKMERWRHTSPLPFYASELNPSFAPLHRKHISVDDFNRKDEIDAHKLVFVNGSYQEHLSKVYPEAQGVTICSMNEALTKHSELITPHLKEICRNPHDGFNLLNVAFFGDGIFIKIPKNTALERPIHWIFLAADNARFMINPYHQIHCGENSKVQIIKEYQSLDNSELYVNSHCSTFLDQGAHLEFTMIQNETVNGFHHLNNHIVYQNRDSQFKQTAVSLAGRLLRNQVFVRLQEPGANCAIQGLYYGKGDDHVDNRITVKHLSPDCESHQNFKGLLDDNSTAVFNGKIYVEEDAQRTNAFQSNKNIILSDHATVHSQPQLEIYADDVKCSHGATSGQIDQDALFYLVSRGIPLDQAKAVLNYAFIAEITEKISLPTIREHIQELMREKLNYAWDDEMTQS